MFGKKRYAFFHSFLLNGCGQSSLQTFKGQKHIQQLKQLNLLKQKCTWQMKEIEMSLCYTCILQKLDINTPILIEGSKMGPQIKHVVKRLF